MLARWAANFEEDSLPNTLLDLHLHSYYSDGRASPGEMLRHAAALGLRGVAFVDHDNVNSLPEARFMAAKLGLELLPGVELTTAWPVPNAAGAVKIEEVDLLGYAFDPEDAAFLATLATAQAYQRQFIEQQTAAVNAAGYPLTVADVEAVNPRFPSFISLLMAMARHGYAKDWNAAFTLFKSLEIPFERQRLPLPEAIAALHRAGGVAVLAHPIAIEWAGGLLPREPLAELVAAGLDGLEVYYRRHDAATQAHFAALAAEFDLIQTGGSDEHGHEAEFSRLGRTFVPYEALAHIQTRAARYTKELP
jgi:predicted metal-dependent phosphoesterase TrpH